MEKVVRRKVQKADNSKVVIPSEARDLQLKSQRRYYVYIMSSRSLNLYTGVTNDIYNGALDDKESHIDGFTKRYKINRLVYYEPFGHVGNAIQREKQIKSWTRAKRIALIESLNPAWADLAADWGRTFKLQVPRFTRDDIKKLGAGDAP